MNHGRRSILLKTASAAGSMGLGLEAFAHERPAVSASAMRLISIGGALTEIIYLLKADTELVGVDTTSIYPTAATRLPNVGYARSLSAEGILALRPTQLFATAEAGPPIVLKQIIDAGIPLSILPSGHQFIDVINRVRTIGRLVHKTDAAEAFASRLLLEWNATQKRVANSKLHKTRVLFVLSQNPSQLMVGGEKTSAAAMIAYAGAHNAISEVSGFKPLTPEAVIAANPDVLLLTDQGMKAVGGIGGVLRLPGIKQTRAGREQKVVSLEAMYLLGFGPRMPLAVTELNLLLQRHGLS
jgi:iron complex transport system substrate-binding protein